MKNNEDYFVILIGKYVNRTKYLTSYIMSSALCIGTFGNVNGLKHDAELHMESVFLWDSEARSPNSAVART